MLTDPSSPIDPTPDADLPGRREEIRRGLIRSNSATVAIMLVALALAVAALWSSSLAERHADASREAERRRTSELWNAQRAQALALRLSGKVGRRQESLNAIDQAARLRTSPELRDEAIAALALLDIEPAGPERAMPPGTDAVGVSADFSRCAFGGDSGAIRVQSMSDGRELARFAFAQRAVMSIEFSPDARWLAARAAGGELMVLDLSTSNVVFRVHLPLGQFSPASVAFHPGSQWMLAGADSGGVRLIDTSSWREAGMLETSGRVHLVRCAPGGREVALAVDQRIEIWDFATRQRTATLAVGGAMTDLAWHPRGRTFAAAHADGRLTMVDRASGRRQTVEAHTMVVNRVFYDPSGTVLVSTSWDGTTRFWRADGGRLLLTAQSGYAHAFDATGARLCYYKERTALGTWAFHLPRGFAELALPIGVSDRVLGVDVSPDGHWVAGTTGEGVHLWEGATREPVASLSFDDAQRVAFAADGRSLVVTTGAGIYRVPLSWDSGTARVTPGAPELLPGTAGKAYWLGFITAGENGGWLASAASAEVALVNLAEPASARIIPWAGPRRSAAASPDGRFLAASIWKGGGTRVAELEQQRVVADLKDEGGLLAFSPDGRWLLVGASTEFLFFETASWQLRRRLERDVASALSGIAAFSPDARFVAVTHSVRQVRLLEPDGGQLLARLDAPQPERITALSVNRDGRVLAAATDHRAIQLWDLQVLREELASRGLDDVATRDALARVGAVLAPGGRFTLAWVAFAGIVVALIFAIYSIRQHHRFVGAYENVETLAARRREALNSAQSQLAHSQKMKALGTLAAGIAHDFNNLLSIIRMAAQLVARQTPVSGSARENFDAIEQAVGQGKNIVRSILGFSRQPSTPDQPFTINQVVSETIAMLSRKFLSGIILTLELDPQAPPVSGDRSRLGQILLNLIVNAAEAMQGTGTLILRVRVQSSPGPCLLPPRSASSYVELAVQDSGPGILPEVLPHIFDPFFTTKQAGTEKGTGLGLTTVYTISQQDGYGLAVSTAPGSGTTFSVWVPLPATP